MKGKDIAPLRNKLLEEQNGICPICKRPVEAPCLDHFHVRKVGGDGRVRGVICRTCNVFLGKIENNCKRYRFDPKELSTTLRSCAEYLERGTMHFIHPSEAPKNPILQKSSYNKLKKLYRGRAKFPEYRVDKKKKNKQQMTVRLKQLFEEYKIKPEFY